MSFLREREQERIQVHRWVDKEVGKREVEKKKERWKVGRNASGVVCVSADLSSVRPWREPGVPSVGSTRARGQWEVGDDPHFCWVDRALVCLAFAFPFGARWGMGETLILGRAIDIFTWN